MDNMTIVLEHGNQFYVTTCCYCNCKFLYQHTDTSFMKNYEDNTYSTKVQCPECKSYISHPKQRYDINDSKK